MLEREFKDVEGDRHTTHVGRIEHADKLHEKRSFDPGAMPTTED